MSCADTSISAGLDRRPLVATQDVVSASVYLRAYRRSEDRIT